MVGSEGLLMLCLRARGMVSLRVSSCRAEGTRHGLRARSMVGSEGSSCWVEGTGHGGLRALGIRHGGFQGFLMEG
eukprot:6557782-Alexandrium_andersonii.AAC.1